MARELVLVDAAVARRIEALELRAPEGQRDLGLAQRDPAVGVEVAQLEVLAQHALALDVLLGLEVGRGRDAIGLLHRRSLLRGVLRGLVFLLRVVGLLLLGCGLGGRLLRRCLGLPGSGLRRRVRLRVPLALALALAALRRHVGDEAQEREPQHEQPSDCLCAHRQPRAARPRVRRSTVTDRRARDWPRMAMFNASRTSWIKCIRTRLRISASRRRQSSPLRAGRMTSGTPARMAARSFSRMPPTARTCPRSDISPVMATSCRTGTPVSSDTSATAMATPAEGPSLGVAADGRCR